MAFNGFAPLGLDVQLNFKPRAVCAALVVGTRTDRAVLETDCVTHGFERNGRHVPNRS